MRRTMNGTGSGGETGLSGQNSNTGTRRAWDIDPALAAGHDRAELYWQNGQPFGIKIVKVEIRR
jgi:hypothetical protein